MDNSLRGSILVAAFIVAISAAYCSFVFLPKKLRQEQIVKCQQLGEERSKNDAKDSSELLILSGKYKFNPILDSCFYSGGSRDFKETGYTHRYIVNLYTNEDVAGYIGPIVPIESLERERWSVFEAEEKRVFGENY